MFHFIYYIGMSVLPKNRQLVFPIPNYIQDTSEIFSISSLVKILLTSFLCFSFVFRLIFFYFSKQKYLCKKKKENYTLVWTYEVYLLVRCAHSWKYFFYSKINFICLRHRVISSIYYLQPHRLLLASTKNTITPAKILHKHCFQFLLGSL